MDYRQIPIGDFCTRHSFNNKMIMKRITVLFLSLVFAIATYGQQKKEVYVIVNVIMTNKATASVDFGDGTPYAKFANEKGKARDFTTAFEPVQEMIKNGWRIEQFTRSLQSGVVTASLYTWLMKKEVNNDNEIREGLIFTKD